MILTVDLPKPITKRLQEIKARTGLSKGWLVRQIILQHFADVDKEQK